MAIKKTTGKISRITDLTETSKEIEIIPKEKLDFISGSFVNFFMNIDGENVRRAYSISSSDHNQDSFTITMRHSLNGKLTPLFWKSDLTNTEIDLMGPLGLNTVDKMQQENVYLFGFGVGAGVIKSLAEHCVAENKFKKVVIITGSRFEKDIIYKDFFDKLAIENEKVSIEYVISRPENPESIFKTGYIQDHIDDYDFNNSDVYVCGQESACNTLVEKIKTKNPDACYFHIEAFH